jgi:EAL domain-containing protein (putative c-di-GMP-specific phosphodiesterase class I)
VPLQSLRRLQADELKIHESFVGELDGMADGAIVGAVVELGHALGMTVVAEGVETDSQLAELRSLGCDMAQGYHLCRPVGADRLEELITHAA